MKTNHQLNRIPQVKYNFFAERMYASDRLHEKMFLRKQCGVFVCLC